MGALMSGLPWFIASALFAATALVRSLKERRQDDGEDGSAGPGCREWVTRA